ncbi:12609_t:CDS:1 [Funneliformis mosseae]|uniref:12609_t:CDS:1 n=1 Tax=Funneliformis mosseae TaxID=27381 RepID=A0A9N8VB33_FUNMO|nr:12609_t:CDS:1 [Funneliformis mosseae]
MSLQGGAVAAGSLVAILQSVGAAGFSIGTVIATSSGGAVLGGYIAKAMLNTLESNREELKELENLVSIDESNVDENEKNKKVIFDMKQPLLDSNENEKLKSFLRGFESAREIAKDRAKRFEFLVIRDFKGSNYLYRYFVDKHGIDYVTSEKRSIFLNLNNP